MKAKTMIEIETNTGNTISIKTMEFAGGERHIVVDTKADLEKSGIALPEFLIVRARIASSNDLMDLMLACNALKAEYNTPLKLEIPYFPYARQDRVCAPGQAFSLNVMTNMVRSIVPKKIAVWDVHSHETVTRLWAINLTPGLMIRSILDAKIRDRLTDMLHYDNLVVVCPDHGAEKRCHDVAELINADMITCIKERDPTNGRIIRHDVPDVDLTGKTAFIIDDICDGGATFIGIAQQLKKLGATKVVLWVTHGIFSKGIDVLTSSGIDWICTTNSRPVENHPAVHVIPFHYDFEDQRIICDAENDLIENAA